jgi:hypothetical protein
LSEIIAGIIAEVMNGQNPRSDRCEILPRLRRDKLSGPHVETLTQLLNIVQ